MRRRNCRFRGEGLQFLDPQPKSYRKEEGMNDYKDGDPGAEQYPLDFQIEVVFYIAISVVFLMMIALMVKLWCDWDGGGGEVGPTETSGLLSAKVEAWFVSYGTSEEDDLESTGQRSFNSSSDDLYDGKICVICYDDQRSCLFVPCGHCITCYNCAKRIISEEIKSCPICRTYIDKVRKLRIL